MENLKAILVLYGLYRLLMRPVGTGEVVINETIWPDDARYMPVITQPVVWMVN